MASLLLVLVAIAALPAHAWDCAGHMLTAKVAELLLPAQINAYFDSIAKYHMAHYHMVTSRTEMACWPDDIKTYMPSQYNAWHFEDQCFNPHFEVPCPSEKPTVDIKIALTKAVGAIAEVNATLEDRSFWLAFILHLVGDFHQPLHTTSLFDARFPDGDMGGNLFLIQYNNSEGELHAWHDQVGGLIPTSWPPRPLAAHPSAKRDLDSMAKQLLLSQPDDPSLSNNTDFDVWLEEGFEAASIDSYRNGTLIFNAPLTSTYVDRLRAILIGKVVLGGRRLATVLWDIYDVMQERNITTPGV